MDKPASFEPRSDAPLIKARSLVYLRHRRRDHHSIVVAAAPEDGYLQAAFESTDVDALGAGAERRQHRGWVKSWGHEYVFGLTIANDVSARDVQLPEMPADAE